MLITAPPSLHYPIRVTALLRQPGDQVQRRAPLFAFTYTSPIIESNRYGEERSVRKTYPAEFESEAEGRVVRWHISVGDTVDRSDTLLIEIEEPCKHEIQFAGLCVNCGKDMTEVDFATTRPNADRATISMVHGHTALRVSQDEANRSSDATMRRLLATKKLSLVVDLDQTIIHAVCDPTVADWQKDESNPNHAAVKDVESFELMDEGPANRPCSYYIKMRQGLKAFLERMSSKFELHIYTMGTRAYAQHVANIVDPERKIFADRILSRDESGSMTAKNLHRLFPVDTKMVIIIDDRGDIWGWSPNLIRVRPFSFFVGIGDINSSFLPQQQDLIAPKSVAAPDSSVKPETQNEENGQTSEAKEGAQAKSIEDQLLQMAGNDPSKIEEQGHKQQEEIAAQVQDRPLLRKQELLDKQDDQEKTSQRENGNAVAPEPRRHPLLQDDDRELEFLEQSLDVVHRAFFTEYERKLAGAQGGRLAELRGEKKAKKARPLDDLLLVPDVKDIMPRMKLDVLAGVVVCFTGVIPNTIDPQFSDLGFWARTFGALISAPLTSSVTHVVADPARRTHKVRQAAHMAAAAAAAGDPVVQIVDKGWLLASFSAWERAPEEPFRIVVEDEPALAITVGGSSGDGGKDAVGAEAAAAGTTSAMGDKVAGLADLALEDRKDALSDGEDEEPLEELPSPIQDIMAGIGGDQWDAWDDELREFLEEDSESDAAAGERAPPPPPSAPAPAVQAAPPTAIASEEADDGPASKKRKRDAADGDGGVPRDAAAAADAPNAGLDGSAVTVAPESELQRRKKRAFERTSSLTQVATADALVGENEGEDKDEDMDKDRGKEVDKKPPAEEKPLNGGGHGDDEYDAAAMEREMLAAFEEEMEGEDEEKGDG